MIAAPIADMPSSGWRNVSESLTFGWVYFSALGFLELVGFYQSPLISGGVGGDVKVKQK